MNTHYVVPIYNTDGNRNFALCERLLRALYATPSLDSWIILITSHDHTPTLELIDQLQKEAPITHYHSKTPLSYVQACEVGMRLALERCLGLEVCVFLNSDMFFLDHPDDWMGEAVSSLGSRFLASPWSNTEDSMRNPVQDRHDVYRDSWAAFKSNAQMAKLEVFEAYFARFGGFEEFVRLFRREITSVVPVEFPAELNTEFLVASGDYIRRALEESGYLFPAKQLVGNGCFAGSWITLEAFRRDARVVRLPEFVFHYGASSYLHNRLMEARINRSIYLNHFSDLYKQYMREQGIPEVCIDLAYAELIVAKGWIADDIEMLASKYGSEAFKGLARISGVAI